MVWLVWRHRDAFRRLRDGMLVSGFLGMMVFVSYPVAPPRLFDLGLVDTVTESSEAYRYLQPPAFVNQYAAMPSLHAGWDLLVGLAILGAAATVGFKAVGVLMPVLMMWAVVATANHYVLDVVAGTRPCAHRARGRPAPRAPPRGQPRGSGCEEPMTVLAIAHRAGNSLAGLAAANDLGVDVIECDVHGHRGRLEVRHLKTAGPLPFLWDRWELVPAAAPRLGLAELLAADRHGTTFMLDLKGRRPTTSRAVAELLHEVGHARPLLACGRWWPAVDGLASDLDFVRPVLSARTRGELVRLRRRLVTGPAPFGVSVHMSLLDAGVVAELHDRVERVLTWPVNDQHALEAVLGYGVSGVISDDAGILAQVDPSCRLARAASSSGCDDAWPQVLPRSASRCTRRCSTSTWWPSCTVGSSAC